MPLVTSEDRQLALDLNLLNVSIGDPGLGFEPLLKLLQVEVDLGSIMTCLVKNDVAMD
jgi:hypothetical protein